MEGFVDFDYEITLLTVRSISGTVFCEPVGHIQRHAASICSVVLTVLCPWPEELITGLTTTGSPISSIEAITDALGGYGIFGVELFVKGDEVIFSEVSPRPHDTGMVTMISQDLRGGIKGFASKNFECLYPFASVINPSQTFSHARFSVCLSRRFASLARRLRER